MIGKESWTRTWPSGTPLHIVEQESRQLAQLHDSLIEVARIESAEDVARSLIRTKSSEWYRDFIEATREDYGKGPDQQTQRILRAIEGGGHVRRAVLLSELIEADNKPLSYAFQSFEAVVGDVDPAQITRRDVTRWIERQQRDGLAPATIQRRLGSLRAVVGRYLLDNELEKPNPFSQHRLKGGGGGPRDRLPLNREMLDDLDRYLDSGACGFETVAVLRIMKCTGLGVAEAAGLDVGDVFLDAQVPNVHVRPNRWRGIKAQSRDRRVPLVGEALEVAQQAVERAQGEGREKLFASFDRSGRGGDTFSAKTAKALRKAGIPRSPRLTPYSLRHGLSEAMRQVGAPFHIHRQIMGHSMASIGDRYGSPQSRLIDAKEWIERALEVLGDVDPTEYRDL